MFRNSASPKVKEAQSTSSHGTRKWIRRLTGVAKPLESLKPSASRSFPPDNKLTKTHRVKSREHPVGIHSTSSRPRPSFSSITPQITTSQAARRPTTPKSGGRRPITPKHRVGRPSTPKHHPHATAFKVPRRSHESRPGTARSNRSTRSQILNRNDPEPQSSSIGSPAYLSCLDDYISSDGSNHVDAHHPNIIHITTDFTHEESRCNSPALPSATSWTLERSLDDLWGWRDLQRDPVDRLSDSRPVSSDDTIAESELSGDGSSEKVKSLSPKKPSSVSFEYLPPITPLHIPSKINRPTLSLPLRPPNRRRPGIITSSPFSVSPSSTLVSSPAIDTREPKEDVWKTVSELRSSWEEGSDNLLNWILQPSAEDDSSDGLLCYRRLAAREKRLGNYI